MKTNLYISPILSIPELEKQGVSRHQIPSMIRRGELDRIGRGLFLKSGGEFSEHYTMAVVARKSSRAVICLLTALRFHELGTQNPTSVWISLPQGGHTPTIEGVALTVVHQNIQSGTEIVTIDGVEVCITTPARTIVDCFRFRNKIGLDVALEALTDGLRSKKVTADLLVAEAVKLRAYRVMKPYLEAILQ